LRHTSTIEPVDHARRDQVIRPASERVLTLITDMPSSGHGRNIETAAVNFLSPPFERSTVPRI
jgi:hypothetical protein